MNDDRHAVQIVARLLAGLPAEPAEIADLPTSWRELVDALAPLVDPHDRLAALRAGLADRPDGTTIFRAILVAAQAACQSRSDAPDAETLVFLSEVETRPVRWLWPGRLPLGKLTVLDGDPGLGKSAITLDIAARVSAGRPMPDGTLADPSPGSALAPDGPRGVVLLSAEDGLADTIRPRLEAAGADLARVVALTAVRDLPARGPDSHSAGRPTFRRATLADVPAIRRAIAAVGAALVVVDPIMAHLPRGADTRTDGDVRALLARLAGLAQADDLAILVVRHLTKAGRGNPLYRGGGSIGIIGAARSGLLVAPDPADETGARRVLASTKANLALSPTSLAYRLASADNGTLQVVWEGPSAHTAASLLDGAADRNREEPTALAIAQEVLRSLLAEGPRPAAAVQAEARAAGISDRTLRRACHALGVRPRKHGYQGAWTWHLPPDTPSPSSVPSPSGRGLG